jgi:hypothetical protein
MDITHLHLPRPDRSDYAEGQDGEMRHYYACIDAIEYNTLLNSAASYLELLDGLPDNAGQKIRIPAGSRQSITTMFNGEAPVDGQLIERFVETCTNQNLTVRVPELREDFARLVDEAAEIVRKIRSATMTHKSTINAAAKLVAIFDRQWEISELTSLRQNLKAARSFVERLSVPEEIQVSGDDMANSGAVVLIDKIEQVIAAGGDSGDLNMPSGWFQLFEQTANIAQSFDTGGFLRIHRNNDHPRLQEVELISYGEMLTALERAVSTGHVGFIASAAYQAVKMDEQKRGSRLEEVLAVTVKNVVNVPTRTWISNLPNVSMKMDRSFIYAYLIDPAGKKHLMQVNTETGDINYDDEIVLLEDTPVLHPIPVFAMSGESRALDAFVNHHFKTPAEVSAFYQQCGISLYGSGVTNLVFLHGSGGSGKDMLFSLMSAVGPGSVNIPIAALMDPNERGSLTMLNDARFAYCAFESSEGFGNNSGLDPATLKTITSGGNNSLTVRPKYGRSAVEVRFRGSLWLYGNHVPNLAGIGDFEGMSRRFSILPLAEPLPKDEAPPVGFSSWEDAIKACAPVFGMRCMEAYINWVRDLGQVGHGDVRLRIPRKWVERSHDELNKGGRSGFLKNVLVLDRQQGMSVICLREIVLIVAKDLDRKIGRLDLEGIIRTGAPHGAWWCEQDDYDDHYDDIMVPKEVDGVSVVPVTVNLKWLDSQCSPEVMVKVRSLLSTYHPTRNFEKVHPSFFYPGTGTK